MSRRLTFAVVLAAALLGGAGLPSARAWEAPIPTMQHTAANAAFLIAAPAPPAPAAMCLIDSGVNLNADTAPGVLDRVALDGGFGDDYGATTHGTYMASIAGAQVNGWGSVGAWPQLKIVSVRALDPGQQTFPFDYYRRAIDRCGRKLSDDGHPVRVIEMALGGIASPSADDLERLRDSVNLAKRDLNIAVVAAAGNVNGPVFYPARHDPVLAVGAATAAGGFCDFSARGAGLDILAPGCGMDVGVLPSGGQGGGFGTSHASAFLAGALTALRAYRPDLTAQQAEDFFVSAATARGGNLDVAGAFRAAGLGHIVDAGNAAIGTQVPQGNTNTPPAEIPPYVDLPPDEPTVSRLVKPKAKVKYRRGRLTIKVSNRPKGSTVQATIEARVRGRLVKKIVKRTSSSLATSWPRGKRLRRVLIAYIPAKSSPRKRSTSLIWKP